MTMDKEVLIPISDEDLRRIEERANRAIAAEAERAAQWKMALDGKTQAELLALLNEHADAAMDFEIFIEIEGGSFSVDESLEYEQHRMRRDIVHELLPHDVREPVRLRILKRWDDAMAADLADEMGRDLSDGERLLLGLLTR